MRILLPPLQCAENVNTHGHRRRTQTVPTGRTGHTRYTGPHISRQRAFSPRTNNGCAEGVLQCCVLCTSHARHGVGIEAPDDRKVAAASFARPPSLSPHGTRPAPRMTPAPAALSVSPPSLSPRHVLRWWHPPKHPAPRPQPHWSLQHVARMRVVGRRVVALWRDTTVPLGGARLDRWING